VDRLRAAGLATVPSKLAAEMAENPFMRAPDVAHLADIRAKKDKF
jgi:hydroxyacylglutathione hydrolase